MAYQINSMDVDDYILIFLYYQTLFVIAFAFFAGVFIGFIAGVSGSR